MAGKGKFPKCSNCDSTKSRDKVMKCKDCGLVYCTKCNAGSRCMASDYKCPACSAWTSTKDRIGEIA